MRSRPTASSSPDGTEHAVDVLIYGTGFQASKFLTPMSIRGRNGVDLHEQWAGDARAYLGVTVPGFPNLFCLYGPNTNIVVNGSIVYFSECGVRYILGLLEQLLRGGHATVDVRKDIHDDVQRPRRRAEPAHGVGLVGREQLVQERTRSRGSELAVHAARVLATDGPARSRRLRVRRTTTALRPGGVRPDLGIPGVRFVDTVRSRYSGTMPAHQRTGFDLRLGSRHTATSATSGPVRTAVPVARRPMSGVTSRACHSRDSSAEVSPRGVIRGAPDPLL